MSNETAGNIAWWLILATFFILVMR